MNNFLSFISGQSAAKGSPQHEIVRLVEVDFKLNLRPLVADLKMITEIFDDVVEEVYSS